LTLVTAGRVGKPHGLDGSFYVDRPRHELPEGAELTVAGRTYQVERRAGTDERPLLRLAGVDDARPLRGELMLIEDELAEDEWLASDLVGLTVPGLGTVTRLIDSPSCTLLELEDGTLIPFIADAVEAIDLDGGQLRVNRDFLS
jgi:16S rRNA processing protein RimM